MGCRILPDHFCFTSQQRNIFAPCNNKAWFHCDALLSARWGHLAAATSTGGITGHPVKKNVSLWNCPNYPYIQKTGLACWKIQPKIQIIRRKIVLECENYQFCNLLRKGQRAYSKTKVSWKVLQNRFLFQILNSTWEWGGTHIVSHNKWLYMLGSFWHNAVYIEFLWSTHFWRKILSWEFLHFFRRFF